MLDEYSIDHRSDAIIDSRTRNYFEEIKSSFTVGNYRSAVVMLWSVVICDLIFKLKDLSDFYNDTTAKSILDDIKKKQDENPNSPAWEMDLIKLVIERTNIIDRTHRAGLEYLQSQRHLSAHPVIHEGTELHRPNRDEVRAMMRHALDSVLTKPALPTRQITEQMLQDIEKIKNLFPSDHLLTTYLESKYFSKFSNEVANAVFKSLWKLVFRTKNQECDRNRDINFRVLILLSKKEMALTYEWVSKEVKYYSNISNDDDILSLTVKFLAINSSLYNLFEEHAKTAISQHAKSNTSSIVYANFLFDNIQAQVEAFKAALRSLQLTSIEREEWDFLINLCENNEELHSIRHLANIYYSESRSFDIADRRFSQAITTELEHYELDDLIDLVNNSNGNSQCYSRGRASIDHLDVRNKILKISPRYDFTPHNHFFSEVTKL
ncbi:hypothetical protein [Martelella alba]|uniref:Uncharacterized protein n=1 Tax=Martelella alba TaxID=2590451 RepID=A0ABY2SQK0_9HYPH|nr:hypothetical protein [Martelella alba]TKI08329.1 hypothetical protein FCN80_04080 [Martelella alba]